MNGVHDLGGMHGFGPVDREEHEPTFHEQWEGRVRAMMRLGLTLGLYNLDEFRWSVERMDPASYLRASYYEKWLEAIERLYIEKGVIGREELERRRQTRHRTDPSRERSIARSPKQPPRPQPAAVPAARDPRFTGGDSVVARNVHSHGHTRLPRYVRGKRGVVHQVRGAYVLPDKSAMGQGAHSEYVYSVRFEARELWGRDAPGRDAVYIDLWESYLEEAPQRGPRP